MSRKRYFAPRDIDHIIPQLEEVFKHIAMCKGRIEILPTPPEPGLIKFLMQAVQDDIDHIMTLGGITKDVDAGLVDFPGQMYGEDVWLCWKRGETKVRYWHGIDEGFSERQTLPQPQAPSISH